MPLKRPAPTAPAKKKRAKPQPKQVGSQFGLVDRSNPFAGLGEPGAGAPARKPAVNLTEQAALAKARRQRLAPGSGGLLSPAQGKAERLASAIVETRARFAAPPPEASTAPPPRRTLQAAVPPRAPARAAGRNVVHGGTRGSSASVGDILGGASVGLGTALSGAASVPRTLLTPIRPGATRTPAEDVKPVHLATATADVARRLNETATGVQGLGVHLPRMIPNADLVGEAKAANKNGIAPEQLVAAGLTGAQTKNFDTLAKRRGWKQAELDHLVGLDRIKRAYSDPPNPLLRLGQNFAAGVIRTGGLVNLPAAAVQEIGSGHGERFATDLVGSLTGGLPVVGKHKFSDMVLADPYAELPIVGGIAKTLGGVGGKLARRELADRVVPLAGTEGRVVNRGPQSQNLYDATREVASDALAKRSPKAARRVWAKEVDDVVADVANEVAPPHYLAQRAEADARKKVGQETATAVQAAQMEGAIHPDGTPDLPRLHAALADWERRAAEDGPRSPAAGQAKFLRERVIPLVEQGHKDIPAYAQAHAALSGHTTSVMQERARFGDTAATYRRFQRPITVAARQGDALGKHVVASRNAWRKADRDAEDFPEIQKTYDDAVAAFAERHASEGGAEPVRVKYTQPPNPNVFRHPGAYRQGFNATPGRVHTSSGASAESGRYLIDPLSAQRENLSAQRLAQRITAAREIVSRLGRPAAKGDEVPYGEVFVPARNLNTAGKVLNELHDNPVAVAGFEQEHGLQKSIHDALGSGVQERTGEITNEAGYFLPKAAWDRMHDYTRPETRNAYDKAMRSYQRLLIGTFPSTTLGNTLGTTPLGFAGGAGGLDYATALSWHGDATKFPATAKGAGVAGALTGDARNPGSRYVNAMLRISRGGEDVTREALYISKMGGKRGMTKRAAELGFKTVEDYARAVAKGEVDVAKRDAALAHTIKFVGDMTKAEGKLGRGAGRLILFHRWVGHVAKLMLYTLPVEHPRRLVLINALAAYGDEYRKKHGVWPSWMAAFSPLFVETKGGQQFTKAVGLGQLAPQGTAGNIFDALTQDQPIQQRIGRLVTPPLGLVLNTSGQQIANEGSRNPVNIPWYVASQLAYALPGAAKLAPRQGQAPESVPFLHERARYYAGPKIGNKSFPLPYDLRPGARPQQGALGLISRVFGLPLYNTPNEGPITAIQNSKEIQRDVAALVARMKG